MTEATQHHPTAHERALAEARRRNAKQANWAQSQALLEQNAQRAVERLGELLEHEDPQVVLAAAAQLLPYLPQRPGGERVTADDVEHEWERRRLHPRIWKRGQEALQGE